MDAIFLFRNGLVLGEEKDMEGGLNEIRGRGRMEELEGCDHYIWRRMVDEGFGSSLSSEGKEEP